MLLRVKWLLYNDKMTAHFPHFGLEGILLFSWGRRYGEFILWQCKKPQNSDNSLPHKISGQLVSQEIFHTKLERKREAAAIVFPCSEGPFRTLKAVLLLTGVAELGLSSWVRGSSQPDVSPAAAKSPSSASSLPGPAV